jgi:transcriptional regulator with XRE-family HTH domain
MTSESPAVARRRLRLALRRAREAAGLTQAQVAEEMEWSVSKVMRIESGEVTITVNDAKLLLPLIKITDKAKMADLLQAARASKQRQQWWDAPNLREHMTPAMRQQIQFETEARVARYFCPAFVHGRLQTDAYATAMFDTIKNELSPETRRGRVESRIRRREELSRRKDPPTILLLLDESVLFRQIGGPQALADQLQFLLEQVRTERLFLRVLPFTEVTAVPNIGTFEILYLTGEGIDGEGDAVMYRESGFSDEIVDDEHIIRRHLDMFERYWHGALDEATSMERLESAAKAVVATEKSPR